MAACSSTKFVEDEQYLLESVEIKADEKSVDASALAPYIRQHANSKWFSLFKIPLGTYALSGRDTTKWINRTLRKIGEEPVIFDSTQARLSIEDLRGALKNMGYMQARVDLQTKVKGKKLKAIYTFRPGTPYTIYHLNYDIQDTQIKEVLDNYQRNAINQKHGKTEGLQVGDRFSVTRLDQERERITFTCLPSDHLTPFFIVIDSTRIIFNIRQTQQTTSQVLTSPYNFSLTKKTTIALIRFTHVLELVTSIIKVEEIISLSYADECLKIVLPCRLDSFFHRPTCKGPTITLQR